MGTLYIHGPDHYIKIAQACKELDIHLIMALGVKDGNRYFTLPEMPANVIVMDWAPQLEILKKANLAISHGGVNSIMEILAEGVPVLGLPMTGDQFQMANRLPYCGAGECIHMAKANPSKIKVMIQKILADGSYKEKAAEMGGHIDRSGGALEAVRIIERGI